MRSSRLIVLGSLFAAVVAVSARPCAAQTASLLGNPQVAPLGLETMWSTFVRVDPNRGRLRSLQLSHGMLLAQTDQGTLQVIHPESGRTLWSITVGSPNYPTQPPSTNGEYTAVTNGTTLYVVDAKTGAPIYQQRVSGSPCAGSAMSADRVYVPLDNGLIEAYLLVRTEGRELFDSIPKRYSGNGGSVTAPVVVNKRCSWSVSQGFIYSAEETFKDLVQFRFKVDADLSCGPATMPPLLFAASRRGTLYGLNDQDGSEVWRFSLGNGVTHPIIPINGALLVVNETGDMVRIDPRFGRQVWYARGIRQFVTVSDERLYALDHYGRLTARNLATGTALGAAPTVGFDLPCYNTESDRVYLASTTGIVQCLRESRLPKPLMHTPGPSVVQPPAAGDAAPADGADPTAPAAAPDPNNPFGTTP